MPLPLEDHARQTLIENDRGSKIHAAVSEGWRQFSALYPQRHRWRRKSSQRNLVWEEVVHQLALTASDDSDMKLVEHRDTVSLVIEGELLLRLKHADISLVTRNYPTEEALSFDDHDVDLFDFPGMQRVKLCYVLDQHETEIIWLGLVATQNGKFLWKIELSGAGTVAEVPRLPLQPQDEDTGRLASLKNPETDTSKKRKDKK